MTRTIRLDVPVLLPEVKDLQDRCIARLVSLLEHRTGVNRVHVVGPAEDVARLPVRTDDGQARGVGQLCLHYDPDTLTLAQVEEFARVAGAEVSGQFGHSTNAFNLIGSEDDGERLERELCALSGVTAASVNLAAQAARVEYDRTVVDLGTIERRLQQLGARVDALRGEARASASGAKAVGAVEMGDEQKGETLQSLGAQRVINDLQPRGYAEWFRRNREIVWSLTAGSLLLAGWLVDRGIGNGRFALALYVGAYFFGARDNVGHVLADLRRGRFHFNIDLLMVVAAAGAAALDQWAEGALLLFLFSLGHALEHYALGRARNAIKALAALAPKSATVRRGGREQNVPIADVRLDDVVIVKPGSRIPVDGVVREGHSAVNQAPITGESVPVDKSAGEKVFAGSVNGDGALVLAVTALVGDSTLDRVVKLVAEAQTQKAPTQQCTDRFARAFVPIVLILDVLLIHIPPLLGVWTWGESFYRAMALLVAASPCALALGTPATVLAGIAQAARHGVLVKGGAHLEALGAISVLALDKTGPITKGEPEVTDIVPGSGVTADELLATAAAVERRSQHPLAHAILIAAEERKLTLREAGELQWVTGRGIRAPVDGQLVEVGRLLMFEESGYVVPNDVRLTIERLETDGRSTMLVCRFEAANDQEEWLGVIGIADEPRIDARETLSKLRRLGIQRIVMLTGDNAGVGEAVGRAVGVDEVRAGLLPEDKVTAIRELAST
ncbi:MAG: heavy metal translocating P-type ATPase [Gemmatimonadaceae bacterium]